MWGAGKASLIGASVQGAVLDAALFNGTIGHVLDFDDVLAEMEAHPSTVVFPVAVALCESRMLSAQEFFSAFITGVEVGARLGSVMNPDHYARGWHATGTLGVFAATAAAGKLLRLSPEQMARAFGIAATQAAGIQGVFGTMAKPLNAGRAAANGLMAGLLAYRGYTAPDNIFEGWGGFLSLFGAGQRSDRITDRHQGHWAVEDIVFKQFPSCYSTHAPMIAALSLRDKCPLDHIRSIRLWIAPMDMGAAFIGYPTDELEARFSLSYCTAVALVKGRGSLREFSPTSLNDTQVRHMASSMKIESQSSLQEFEAILEVELQGGKHLKSQKRAGEISPTAACAPMVERKFLDGATPIIGSRCAHETVEKVYQLDSTANLEKVMQLVVLGATVK